MSKSYYDVSPRERVREPSNDEFYDECAGILLGFKERLESRGGWVDMFTIEDAVKEMRDLVVKHKDIINK